MAAKLHVPAAAALSLTLSACPGPPPPKASPAPTATASAPAPAPVTKPGPPLARRDSGSYTLHGTTIADPYLWLEDGKSADTKAFLAAHDAFTRKTLDAIPGRDALAKRLTELSYLAYTSAPRRRGKRYFFRRRDKKQEKEVWYWREGKKGKLHTLIDPNTLSKDGSVSLHGVWPDHQGKRAAYKLSKNNADEATLYVMDVATGKTSKVDTIEGAKYASASWDPKGTGFYYTWLPVDPKIPTDKRPGHAEVRFHRLGDDPAKDEVVLAKTGDPKIFVDGEVSRDGRHLFAYKFHGWNKNDLYYRKPNGKGAWREMAVGKNAKFYAEAHEGKIYIHTNEGASRFKVMVADPKKGLTPDTWKELIPEDPKGVLRSVSIVGGKLALRYLKNASSEVRIATLEGKPVRTIQLPGGIGSVAGLYGHPDDDEAYYAYQSFTEPTTIYSTSVKKGGSELYFKLDVPVKTAPYTTKQVWFKSKDGTKVSMFIIGRKDLKKDGNRPVLLYGYGGFDIVLSPKFRASRFAWLERGGVLAIPNLRGGGEYGEAWHRDGMLDKKQNVFDDFIGAARYLIDQGYTKPARLAIQGGSNGGLLVGAVMTQEPDLYGAVVCSVPLLDMVRYHQFGSGRTWISEYGSSEDAKMFPVLKAYSPYHRIEKDRAYPSMLMLTADSDDRVDPLHARKFVAKLRHRMANDTRVLLRVETNAGHGGGDMVKKSVARQVDVYSYLFDQLGM